MTLFFFLFVLESAILSDVLRTSAESDVTLFRLLVPLTLLLLVIKNKKIAFFYLLSFFCFFVVQVLSLGISDYRYSEVQLVFFIHYSTMLFFFFLLLHLFQNNREQLWLFLKFNYWIMAVAVCLQYYFPFNVPNIEMSNGVARIWFTSENDLALAMMSFIILSLYIRRLRQGWFFHLLAFYALLSWIDSKASILAFLVYLFFAVLRGNWTYTSYLKYCSLCGLFVLIVYFFDWHAFAGSELGEAVVRLVTLDPYPEPVGSLPDRIQVFIYAIKEFFDNPILGIGSGNTTLMITDGKFYDFNGYIASMHNMYMQILVELGLLVVLPLLYFLKKLSKKSKFDFVAWLAVTFILSLVQSGGYLTNFYAQMTIFFMLFSSRQPKTSIDKIGV